MGVKILGVTESRGIDSAGRVTKGLVVTYKVDTLGPFTLNTTQADLQSGKALQEMQAFAATLGTLPMA